LEAVYRFHINVTIIDSTVCIYYCFYHLETVKHALKFSQRIGIFVIFYLSAKKWKILKYQLLELEYKSILH